MSHSDEIDLVGGRYKIVRELGRGGAAVVYLARDTRIGGQVAIKVLHEDLAGSQLADRFRREIRLMAEFRHVNILPVLDSGLWQSRPFYVSAYLDQSESLRDRLVHHPTGLAIRDVIEMARGLCSALGYAHERKILHRDVKPENILMTGSHPYLTDFGIAKALEPIIDEPDTSTGYIFGTKRYMSPEQELADPLIDHRTDIWSLSCVIFEALCGLHPFNSPDAARTTAMKINSRPESLRRHRPTVPAWLEKVVEKGLQPNPSDRWQSVDELAQALGQSGFFEILAEEELARLITTRSARSFPRARAIATTVVLIGIVGAALVWWPRGPGTGQPEKFVALPPHILAVNINTATSDSVLQHFAYRLNAEVVRELAKVPAFRVLPFASMEPCRQRQSAGCDQLMDAHTVETMLDASLEHIGDSIELKLGMVDERTNAILPGITLTVPLETEAGSVNRLAVRLTTIYRQLLGNYREQPLAVTVGANDAERKLLSAAARERADADSLAALPSAVEQQFAFAALQRADAKLALVTAANPARAALWVERGWIALAMSERDVTRRREMFTQALQFIDSAFTYDRTSARAYELRGHVRLATAAAMDDGAEESIKLRCAAEEDLRQAIAGDDSLYRAWAALSRTLWSAGRTNEAKLAVDHAMEFDTYYRSAREGLRRIFITQLLLENYEAARQVCLSGHDLWPKDFKFLECRLTLMLYDRSTAQNIAVAQALRDGANRLDSPNKARVVGSEYRPLYRDLIVAIIAARNGDSVTGLRSLDQVRGYVERSGSRALKYDFSPQEATLVWELGDHESARAILVDWLKNRPDEVPNFRQDPVFRRMQIRDDVLRDAGLPLVGEPLCKREGMFY